MEKCTERYQLSASKCFMHFSSILRHALMLLKNPQGSRLGVDHLTIEEGVDDFEKQILCMHTYTKKKQNAHNHCQKKFMQVQWAEKKNVTQRKDILRTHIPRKIPSGWKGKNIHAYRCTKCPLPRPNGAGATAVYSGTPAVTSLIHSLHYYSHFLCPMKHL